MNGSRPERRLAVNPLEILILVLVLTGFGFSVFSSVREGKQFQFAALQPMRADPTRSDRLPASAPQVPLEVPCSTNPGFQLNGHSCSDAQDIEFLRSR